MTKRYTVSYRVSFDIEAENKSKAEEYFWTIFFQKDNGMIVNNERLEVEESEIG